jgi:hypothetical protein
MADSSYPTVAITIGSKSDFYVSPGGADETPALVPIIPRWDPTFTILGTVASVEAIF